MFWLIFIFFLVYQFFYFVSFFKNKESQWHDHNLILENHLLLIPRWLDSLQSILFFPGSLCRKNQFILFALLFTEKSTLVMSAFLFTEIGTLVVSWTCWPLWEKIKYTHILIRIFLYFSLVFTVSIYMVI